MDSELKALRNADHPLYHRWTHIIDRCTNPRCAAWKNYGGRGIRIFPQWRASFRAFAAYIEEELGPKPEGDYSLDRKDNDKGYEPGNLRWASRTVQNRNQRRVRRTADGIAIRDLISLPVSATTAIERMRNGLDASEATSKPLKFDRYWKVLSSKVVPSRYAGETALQLTLECGCVVRRQNRSYRPIPAKAKCDTHGLKKVEVCNG